MTIVLDVQSIEDKILRRIHLQGAGSVVVPHDFLDLGSRRAVDLALHRMARRGAVRRLARGLYDYPKTHPILGTLQPSAETVAKSLAARDHLRLQPAGAYAANLLGLTEQVPAKVTFLTDGPTRTVRIGSMVIQLRRTSPRNMAAAGQISGLIIQALRHLGKDHITPQRIARLRQSVPSEKRRSLIDDLRLAPTWMHPILRELAEA